MFATLTDLTEKINKAGTGVMTKNPGGSCERQEAEVSRDIC